MDRNAINTINQFRNQCNSFFMEVVSLFCFGYSPCGCLEEDTYRQLMSYVTSQEGSQTKPFSPFSDTMDVTPVVRSFLLQQLLKSRYIDCTEVLILHQVRHSGSYLMWSLILTLQTCQLQKKWKWTKISVTKFVFYTVRSQTYLEYYFSATRRSKSTWNCSSRELKMW